MKYLVAIALIITGLLFGYTFGIMPLLLLDLTFIKAVMWVITGSFIVATFGLLSAITLTA